MSNTLSINVQEFGRLEQALRSFPGNAEEAINAVLHNEGGLLIQEAIQPLIPQSGKTWAGKRAPARTGNSLRSTNENLYFPDDGSSTRRHVGDQQFFFRGAESVKGEVIDRCVGRLIQTFEKGD